MKTFTFPMEDEMKTFAFSTPHAQLVHQIQDPGKNVNQNIYISGGGVPPLLMESNEFDSNPW